MPRRLSKEFVFLSEDHDDPGIKKTATSDRNIADWVASHNKFSAAIDVSPNVSE